MTSDGPHHHVRSGEILHIGEIVARGRAANATSVRVLGTLRSYDLAESAATIEHNGSSLRVDTSALEAHAFRSGELLQFIGEVSVPNSGDPILRARIVRHVASMNLELFDRALAMRRDFEADARNFLQGRGAAPSGPSASSR